MKRVIIAIALIVLIISSCKEKKQVLGKLNYDIQINYLETPVSNNDRMHNDTLLILFDGNYNEDTVNVLINGKQFKNMVLTTDERIGVAGDLETIQYNKVKNIGLSINNGKLIFIEPESRHYNIRLTYLDSVAIVRFYRKLPAFY